MKRVWRLSALVVLLVAGLWLAPTGTLTAPAVAQATGGLQADFDNDGFADLAVGVPLEDVQGRDGAGAVNVLYGSAGGLTGTGSQLFWQGASGVAGTAEATDEFGSSLAAGDFDNDGFADLAVGVPLEAIGSIRGAGAVNILYGSANGLTGTGSQLFRQGAGGVAGNLEAGDSFGSALSAGDFDNDGFSDLAVGAPDEAIGTVRFAGAINVLYGSADGLTGTGSQAFWQGPSGGVAGNPQSEDGFGSSLAAGDFNNNGLADLAVGVPGESMGVLSRGGAGAVNVLYGSAGGLRGTGSQLFRQGAGGVGGTLEFGDGFGAALSAGNFGNGAAADLAVGVPLEDITGHENAGAVNVLYGSAGGLTGAGGQMFWQGPGGVTGTLESFDWFGDALSAGDFNNNGPAELAVGVPHEAIGTVSLAGAVNVLPGTTAGLTGVGSQGFWQGSGGAAGTLEADDQFGSALVNSDQPTG
jgi:FG-GAP repeat protein